MIIIHHHRFGVNGKWQDYGADQYETMARKYQRAAMAAKIKTKFLCLGVSV